MSSLPTWKVTLICAVANMDIDAAERIVRELAEYAPVLRFDARHADIRLIIPAPSMNRLVEILLPVLRRLSSGMLLFEVRLAIDDEDEADNREGEHTTC